MIFVSRFNLFWRGGNGIIKTMRVRKFLKFVWNEFVYGGHITALAALSVVLTGSIVLDLVMEWHFGVIVYLGVYLVYFFNRYKEYKTDYFDNIARFNHLNNYFSIIPFWGISVTLFFIVFVFYYASLSGIVFAFALLFLGILYSLILKRLTRLILAFKSIFVSLMWSLLIIFFVFYHSLNLDLAVWLFFLFVFFRMFVHSSFFDIKDIESDKKQGLLTLPIKLEEFRLFYLLNFISLISLIPIVIGVYFEFFPFFSLFLLITFFISFYYLKNYKKYKKNLGLFSQVAISGEKILWLFIIFISKFIF